MEEQDSSTSILMDKATEDKIRSGKILIVDPLEIKYASSRNPDEYHVCDMSANKGSGECSCQHFQYRIRPRMQSGEVKPFEAGSQCKHIILSLMILGDRLVKAVMKQRQ